LSDSLRLSELSATNFVAALLPAMFSPAAPRAQVVPFALSMAEFHPSGFRTMARASAEADLRDVLPRIDVPTLLVHGESDVRAQRSVAEALRASIPSSRLIVLTGVGHVSSVEAPDQFNRVMRPFLRESAAGQLTARRMTVQGRTRSAGA
jgi:pimeloyl-ACP methyl ester carboxylesterase